LSVHVEVLGEAEGALTVPELAWVRDVTPAERPVTVARNDAGEIVSVCHSARATDRAAEAGVETAPAFRRRGLAGTVVVAWAAEVLSEGRRPMYSTQWTNGASRSVARRLGLVAYAEDWHD
jgi:predicted GNAT family acetyltransferase